MHKDHGLSGNSESNPSFGGSGRALGKARRRQETDFISSGRNAGKWLVMFMKQAAASRRSGNRPVQSSTVVVPTRYSQTFYIQLSAFRAGTYQVEIDRPSLDRHVFIRILHEFDKLRFLTIHVPPHSTLWDHGMCHQNRPSGPPWQHLEEARGRRLGDWPRGGASPARTRPMPRAARRKAPAVDKGSTSRLTWRSPRWIGPSAEESALVAGSKQLQRLALTCPWPMAVPYLRTPNDQLWNLTSPLSNLTDLLCNMPWKLESPQTALEEIAALHPRLAPGCFAPTSAVPRPGARAAASQPARPQGTHGLFPPPAGRPQHLFAPRRGPAIVYGQRDPFPPSERNRGTRTTVWTMGTTNNEGGRHRRRFKPTRNTGTAGHVPNPPIPESPRGYVSCLTARGTPETHVTDRRRGELCM
ncbi:hypothetical protein CSOJ01_15140 [Colletotrichum sojae]|uniref:Uncharacterized protein n=1 Tax=Colletotrichum sojae TaxID=2175907 RepID=A0A8H6INY9_9PEZI|nr:hypothetical protein CSOJ01_15140 [Colletotrichum sojae]